MKLRTQWLMLKGALTKRAPIYVQFAVSNRCNLRCLMCNVLNSRRNERELGLDEIEKLAQILKELNTAILILTGGEPLIRHDLPQIVRLFTEKGIEVRLQTNSMLVNEEKIRNLVKAGLKEVTISLDSLDPKKYDAITGVDGSWNKIVKGIALFSQYLPKEASILGINTVVSKMNLEEIPKIIEFVTGIGFYISLIPVHISDTIDNGFIVRKNSPDFKFDSKYFDTIDKIYATIINMKRQGYRIYNSFRFLAESREFLKNNKVSWRCDSPFLYFSISPAGIFLPCVDIPTSISMLEGDFVKRFYSKEFINSVREIVKKCPGCMYACYPEISYFCHDCAVFIERIIDGFKMRRYRRDAFSDTRLFEMIEDIKQGDNQ